MRDFVIVSLPRRAGSSSGLGRGGATIVCISPVAMVVPRRETSAVPSLVWLPVKVVANERSAGKAGRIDGVSRMTFHPWKGCLSWGASRGSGSSHFGTVKLWQWIVLWGNAGVETSLLAHIFHGFACSRKMRRSAMLKSFSVKVRQSYSGHPTVSEISQRTAPKLPNNRLTSRFLEGIHMNSVSLSGA
jgi:hypothetical protein